MSGGDGATQQQLFVLGAIVIAGFLLLGWAALRTHGRVKKIWGGAGTSGDPDTNLVRRTMHLEARMDEMEPRVRAAEAAAATSIQKVGFLRFNPFQDTGGDQSFSVALLNQKNDGFVLSALYMREGTRLYAKEIRNGTARQPLSEEEARVLEDALHRATDVS